MAKYFCPDCGYEGDEQICPYCYKPAESLDVDLSEKAGDEKYAPEDLADADLKDEVPIEELEEDLDEDDK